MSEDYNGWTNRETWATALHINNDQWLQEQALDYAKTSWEEHAEDEESQFACAVESLAESLENWLSEDLLTRENIAGNEGLFMMLSDIGSLYRVNWFELAESFLSDAQESEKVSA